jgi:hypothetical protein
LGATRSFSDPHRNFPDPPIAFPARLLKFALSLRREFVRQAIDIVGRSPVSDAVKVAQHAKSLYFAS